MEYRINDHKKGDTFSGLTFDVTVNNTPLDLTSAVIKMALKNSKTSKVVTKLFSTVDSSIVVTNALSGQFKISKQVIDIPAGLYFFDIQITLSNGTVKTYIEGSWKITQDITE